jgi:hypothetical protein
LHTHNSKCPNICLFTVDSIFDRFWCHPTNRSHNIVCLSFPNQMWTHIYTHIKSYPISLSWFDLTWFHFIWFVLTYFSFISSFKNSWHSKILHSTKSKKMDVYVSVWVCESVHIWKRRERERMLTLRERGGEKKTIPK